MPNIGEIRRAKEVGYKGRALFTWTACEGCGIERWRPLRSKYKLCWNCGANKREREKCPITYISGEPNLGDTALASQVGMKGRAIHIYAACPDCGDKRWVRRVVSKELCPRCAVKGIHIGELHGRWKGGIKKSKGYIWIPISKNDPMYVMVKKGNKVAEHRLVIARSINRPLKDDEVVHHINGVKNDNRLENLQLLTYHTHHPMLTYQATQYRLNTLEARMTIVEAENVLLKKILQEVRDSVPEANLILQRYNTPSNFGNEVEGIVQPSSNRDNRVSE